MATLQGVTRRGFLHDLPDYWALNMKRALPYWLYSTDSPYFKLRYTDDDGVRWTLRMKNR